MSALYFILCKGFHCAVLYVDWEGRYTEYDFHRETKGMKCVFVFLDTASSQPAGIADGGIGTKIYRS